MQVLKIPDYTSWFQTRRIFTVSRCPDPHAYKSGVQPKQFLALTSTGRDLQGLASLHGIGLPEYKSSLTRDVSPRSAALHNVNGDLLAPVVGFKWLIPAISAPSPISVCLG